MTTARVIPARLPLLRRAAIAIALALGVTVTALPAQEASASALTYTVAGRTVTAPNWGSKIAVWTALDQRGDPYVYGATGPNSFDCSGLTSYAWKRAGISLPRTSGDQASYGRPVSRANLRPGDLVFFYSPVSHAALYIGNGRIVHAPNSGSVVQVVRLSDMYGYAGARRPY
jgi:cell wall-associated NlpC family hydrolase